MVMMCMKTGIKQMVFIGDENKEVPQRVQPGTSYMKERIYCLKSFPYVVSPQNLATSEVFSDTPMLIFGGAPHGQSKMPHFDWSSEGRMNKTQL